MLRLPLFEKYVKLWGPVCHNRCQAVLGSTLGAGTKMQEVLFLAEC